MNVFLTKFTLRHSLIPLNIITHASKADRALFPRLALQPVPKRPRPRLLSVICANSDGSKKNDVLLSSLRSDLKHSMKIKDLTQRDVIKSLLGDLQNSEHAKHQKSYEKVIESAIKKRLEAARLSLESNPPRPEVNQQNLEEVEILKKYLLLFGSSHTTSSSSEDELIKMVKDSIQKSGFSIDATLQERQGYLGKLIKSVKENGDCNADGKMIASVVKRVLQLQ